MLKQQFRGEYKIKKIHKCNNDNCTNLPLKDKYGNYTRYCCVECKEAQTKIKYENTYAKKDIAAISAKRRSTVRNKYGVDNVSQTADVRAKLQITTAATADKRLESTKANYYDGHTFNSKVAFRDMLMDIIVEHDSDK